MLVKKKTLLVYAVISLFVFVLGVGSASASEYVNFYGITITNEEYNTLLNLGFNEEEIYYMTEDVYNENKDLDATLLLQNEKYYKTLYTYLDGETSSVEVTKNEYDNQTSVVPRGTVETTYKKMVSTLSRNGSYFRYKVSLSWKNIPSTRSYDIIGVGFDDPVYIYSPVYFTYYSCDTSANCGTSTQYYDRKKTSTGGSVVYKVPNSLISLSATLYYDVAKDTSSTITRLDMYADYAHATKTITVSNAANHQITHSGIELNANNTGYYDAIPCAVSSWAGSW